MEYEDYLLLSEILAAHERLVESGEIWIPLAEHEDGLCDAGCSYCE